ncbi:MAG: FHA domain-containing protein [Hyphomicrobiaceae bacterium]|nr:FHA domain-containing protein [Hyphomicrobiaceae bacterium]
MDGRGATFSFDDRARKRASRRLRRFLALSLAAVVVGALALAPKLLNFAPAGTVPEPVRAWLVDTSTLGASLTAEAGRWIITLNQNAPALALGLAVAAMALLLVLAGVLFRWLLPQPAINESGDTGEVAAGPEEDAAAPVEVVVADPSDRTGHARPRRVWLSAGTAADSARQLLKGELTRLGSAPDNEIRIALAGVDGYHAAISRSAEFDHYLVAMSSDAPTELNGVAVARRRLRNGDVIGIGDARLVFWVEER